MDRPDILLIVREAIDEIAPDVDLDTVEPAEDLMAAADLDSMDFLNILTAIHDRTGVDIPERDYPRVRTLAGLVEYLAAATV